MPAPTSQRVVWKRRPNSTGLREIRYVCCYVTRSTWSNGCATRWRTTKEMALVMKWKWACGSNVEKTSRRLNKKVEHGFLGENGFRWVRPWLFYEYYFLWKVLRPFNSTQFNAFQLLNPAESTSSFRYPCRSSWGMSTEGSSEIALVMPHFFFTEKVLTSITYGKLLWQFPGGFFETF